jgi:hypothetical protein
MQLTIANVSTQVTHKEFRAAVAAIGKQVTLHFKPEWGVGATLKAIALPLGAKKAPIQRGADAVIYLGDSSSDSNTGVKGAYGYHDTNNKRIPYGFVYLDICAESKEIWTSVLSHEVMELLADPDAVLTVSGPRPKHASGPKPKHITGTVYYDLEVCDPTQGDQYKIDKIVVSNFVRNVRRQRQDQLPRPSPARVRSSSQRLPPVRAGKPRPPDMGSECDPGAEARQEENQVNPPQRPPHRPPHRKLSHAEPHLVAPPEA